MAESSWPSPGHNSRNVTDVEYEQLASRFSDDGIDGDPTQGVVVTAGTGLQVAIAANTHASVRGHFWTSGSTDVTLSIGANSSGSTRTDAVVLRLDRSTWDVRAAVVPGTPGSGAPSITQDPPTTGVWEILLAHVTVPDGATSVTVTDRPQYIGSRIRPENDGAASPNPRLGTIAFRPNTARWRGWTGSEYVTIYENSGQLSLGPGYSTWETVYSNIGEFHNGWVWLRVWVRRVSSTFSTNDSDGGSKIGEVPTALRSPYHNFYTGTFTNKATSSIEVRNDGVIWASNPSRDVAVGQQLRITLPYLLIP